VPKVFVTQRTNSNTQYILFLLCACIIVSFVYVVFPSAGLQVFAVPKVFILVVCVRREVVVVGL